MTVMQLRCFIEVAKELNYARAARNLFISQPAVSRHIMSLEDDLGVELFIRNRQRVVLTAAGNRFLSDAADILERIELSKHNIQSNPGGETLSVGCVASIQITELSRIYALFHKQRPQVIINNTEISPFDYRRVSSGEHLDVAFVPGARKRQDIYSAASLAYHTLYRGELCCIVRKDHRLAKKDRISFDDLAGETLILLDHEHCPAEMDDIQLAIRRSGKDLMYFYSGSSLYTVPMIEAGLGIAVMPDFVYPSSENTCAITFDMDYDVEYGLICRANDRTALVQSFLTIAKHTYGIIK